MAVTLTHKNHTHTLRFQFVQLLVEPDGRYCCKKRACLLIDGALYHKTIPESNIYDNVLCYKHD
jgi:hypothetical protein